MYTRMGHQALYEALLLERAAGDIVVEAPEPRAKAHLRAAEPVVLVHRPAPEPPSIITAAAEDLLRPLKPKGVPYTKRLEARLRAGRKK